MKAYLEFDICGVPVEIELDMEYDVHLGDGPNDPSDVNVTSVLFQGEEILKDLNDSQKESLHYQAMRNEEFL